MLDRVGLGDWLAGLPDGLDTRLDGGQGLSAGEGQLVAFARAFLAEPGVVVLDEASSRLDPVTESRIAEATDALLSGRTAVIIAHRLDTLDRVDEIAVLESGRVVEHGSRAELAHAPTSRFARLRRAAVLTGAPLDAALDLAAGGEATRAGPDLVAPGPGDDGEGADRAPGDGRHRTDRMPEDERDGNDRRDGRHDEPALSGEGLP